MNNFINKTKQPFTVVTNDILQGETVFENANQKLCYLYLYSLKHYKKVFPSHETISKAICASTSTVKRTLKGLMNLGVLEIQKRPGKTHLYILHDYKKVYQNDLGYSELDEDDIGQNDNMNYQNEPSRGPNLNYQGNHFDPTWLSKMD